jgi:hypothetical protein
MKKLLLFALFSFGIFSISNAQVLTYTLTNSSSTVSWDYAMADAGPTPAIYELGIIPGGVRTGAIFNFASPLQFKCQNTNGCGTSQTVPGPIPGIYVPIGGCAVPTAIKYKVDIVVPFIVYHLELKFG